MNTLERKRKDLVLFVGSIAKDNYTLAISGGLILRTKNTLTKKIRNLVSVAKEESEMKGSLRELKWVLMIISYKHPDEVKDLIEEKIKTFSEYNKDHLPDRPLNEERD